MPKVTEISSNTTDTKIIPRINPKNIPKILSTMLNPPKFIAFAIRHEIRSPKTRVTINKIAKATATFNEGLGIKDKALEKSLQNLNAINSDTIQTIKDKTSRTNPLMVVSMMDSIKKKLKWMIGMKKMEN